MIGIGSGKGPPKVDAKWVLAVHCWFVTGAAYLRSPNGAGFADGVSFGDVFLSVLLIASRAFETRAVVRQDSEGANWFLGLVAGKVGVAIVSDDGHWYFPSVLPLGAVLRIC